MDKFSLFAIILISYLIIALCYTLAIYKNPIDKFCEMNGFNTSIVNDGVAKCLNDKEISEQQVYCKYSAVGEGMVKIFTFQNYAKDIECYWLKVRKNEI